jgi:hypothetical protein
VTVLDSQLTSKGNSTPGFTADCTDTCNYLLSGDTITNTDFYAPVKIQNSTFNQTIDTEFQIPSSTLVNDTFNLSANLSFQTVTLNMANSEVTGASNLVFGGGAVYLSNDFIDSPITNSGTIHCYNSTLPSPLTCSS